MSDHISSPVISRRRFMTNSAVTVGALAGAGTLLDACNTSNSSTSGSSSGGGKTTTLTVMYASNEMTKEYVAEFEKLNPTIKISFIEFDQTRLDAMLAANTPPDFVRGGGVGSANITARGLALNLDPYLEKSSVLKQSDLLPVNDTWRWDGKKTGQGSYYGLAKDWSQDGMMWVNNVLFEQTKVPTLSTSEPTTFDALLEAARKLTVRKGGKIQVYGLDPMWVYCSSTIMQMTLQQGAPLYNADLSQIDFTSAAAQKAIQWYVDFASAHVGPSPFDPNPDGAGNDTPIFQSKRLAVSGYGYWFGGVVFTAPDDVKAKSSLIPAPMMGSKRVSACYAATGAWIPSASKNKDAAWKLMEYFMGGKPAHDRAKSGWGLPALKSLFSEIPQDLPYQKQAYQTTQNELQYFSVLPDSPYLNLATLNTTFDKYMQQAVKNQISVSTAAQRITEDTNKLMQQAKQHLS
jgi:multiple sugar transport system substrate-binding protein